MLKIDLNTDTLAGTSQSSEPQYLGSVPLPRDTSFSVVNGTNPSGLIRREQISFVPSMMFIVCLAIIACSYLATRKFSVLKSNVFFRQIMSLEGQILMRASIALIGFLLFYKWSCLITHSGFNLDGTYHDRQPFKFELTWYIWIGYIVTQAALQFPFITYNSNK